MGNGDRSEDIKSVISARNFSLKITVHAIIHILIYFLIQSFLLKLCLLWQSALKRDMLVPKMAFQLSNISTHAVSQGCKTKGCLWNGLKDLQFSYLIAQLTEQNFRNEEFYKSPRETSSLNI